MNASQLKAEIESTGQNPHFFDRKTMKFFGDTLANFAVTGPVKIYDWSGELVMCWNLYRKRATKSVAGSGYHFCVSTFRRVSGPRFNVTVGYRMDAGVCSVIPTHSVRVNVSAPNAIGARAEAMETVMSSEPNAQHFQIVSVTEA
jgi:hypothetical protein